MKLSSLAYFFAPHVSRSPCGERGLKSPVNSQPQMVMASLPVRGAWIEIGIYQTPAWRKESLPVRGAWIEIPYCERPDRHKWSLPVRGALIEILRGKRLKIRPRVAPRAGSVD